MFQIVLFISIGGSFISIQSCDIRKSDSAGGIYVKPSVNYKGQIRKGYVRRKVSLKKNAIKSKNRSRYYYHTRGRYWRRNYDLILSLVI